MASGDLALGQTFQELLRQRNRTDFLLSAEAPFDLQHQHYALSYFRIFQGHIPAERYADPFYPIMIAVTGFDDREMINRALLYRYIISYEPYNFKGNLSDFPLTIDYGRKVDAFRVPLFRLPLEGGISRFDGRPSRISLPTPQFPTASFSIHNRSFVQLCSSTMIEARHTRQLSNYMKPVCLALPVLNLPNCKNAVPVSLFLPARL